MRRKVPEAISLTDRFFIALDIAVRPLTGTMEEDSQCSLRLPLFESNDAIT
ncbi:hypothetical protein Pan54_33500 [Rubinisphaera italica]|uniref:Uncharacterized protein n=1 Tax=Rubinisphaera italica TaxID=2527969 RepID=A0A5C5XHP0_9PLAN|nr:hypothetical protein Pan54_33500 [Rubinisphaera italica]